MVRVVQVKDKKEAEPKQATGSMVSSGLEGLIAQLCGMSTNKKDEVINALIGQKDF
jgi:hypothetical protein